MTSTQTTLKQYLVEAHATEVGLVRVLQSQIAVAPRGALRQGLETHLAETRTHAERLQARLGELGEGANPVEAVGGTAVALAQTVVAQGLALAKTPLDLVRGHGGHEKVLKNAKDAMATEALEIGTYLAIEQVARSAGDDKTAKLAVEIRTDEERMLEKLRAEVPKLAATVVGGKPFDPAETGIADAARKTEKKAARKAKATARKTSSRAKATTSRTAQKAGVKAPLKRYDDLTVAEVKAKVGNNTSLGAEVKRYEQAHKDRQGVVDGVPS